MTEEKKSRSRYYADRKTEDMSAYHRDHVQQFNFKLRRTEDAELIEIYENIPNKANFIREALRRYAEEHNIKTEDE